MIHRKWREEKTFTNAYNILKAKTMSSTLKKTVWKIMVFLKSHLTNSFSMKFQKKKTLNNIHKLLINLKINSSNLISPTSFGDDVVFLPMVCIPYHLYTLIGYASIKIRNIRYSPTIWIKSFMFSMSKVYGLCVRVCVSI